MPETYLCAAYTEHGACFCSTGVLGDCPVDDSDIEDGDEFDGPIVVTRAGSDVARPDTESSDFDWLPVAIVTLPGTGGTVAFDMNDEWDMMRDELLSGWNPPADHSMAVDPAGIAPPFQVRFTAMQRGQFVHMEEFAGW